MMAVSGGLIAPASAAPAGPDREPSSAESVGMRAPALPEMSSRDTSVDPAGYWTLEMMASAVPIEELVDTVATRRPVRDPRPADIGKPGTASEPVLPTQNQDGLQAMAAAPVPSTVGKLFFRLPDGRPSSCSAATVNSGAKDLIETAGHCVYTPGAGWHSELLFAPGHYNGPSAAGFWNWGYARTFNLWINNRALSHDQAFVELLPKNGVRVVDAVGGNGFSWNYSASQPDVRIWGYPGNLQDGEVPYYCDGATSPITISGYSMAAMSCAMGGGD